MLRAPSDLLARPRKGAPEGVDSVTVREGHRSALPGLFCVEFRRFDSRLFRAPFQPLIHNESRPRSTDSTDELSRLFDRFDRLLITVLSTAIPRRSNRRNSDRDSEAFCPLNQRSHHSGRAVPVRSPPCRGEVGHAHLTSDQARSVVVLLGAGISPRSPVRMSTADDVPIVDLSTTPWSNRRAAG